MWRYLPNKLLAKTFTVDKGSRTGYVDCTGRDSV